jgi:fucose permease
MVKKPLLFAAFCGTFLFGFISVFWGMVNRGLEDKFGSVSAILMVYALGLVIGSIVSGQTIDRLGNKIALSTGMALVAIGAFGLARVETLPLAFVMAILVGFGGSSIVTGANALVPEIASTDAARGLWANIINNFFAVGAFVGPFVLATLTLPQAGTILAIAAVAVFALYLVVSMPPPKAAGVSLTAGAGPILARPLFWSLTGMLFLYVGCEVAVWQWLNRYLTEVREIETAAAGFTISLFAIGIIVGRIISSIVLAKGMIGPVPLTLVGAVAIVITYTGILFVTELFAIRVMVTLAGVAMAPMFPTILAATGIHFPKNTGTAIGLALTGGWFGSVVIPPTIGWMPQLHTGMFLPSVAAALMVVAAAVAVALSKQAVARAEKAGG